MKIQFHNLLKKPIQLSKMNKRMILKFLKIIYTI